MAVAIPPLPIARFSVDQYHRMIQSGAFTEDDHVELIDGWVVRKMAKGPGHEFTTGQLGAALAEQTRPEMHVRNQAPLTLGESEPEPDIAIVRGTRGDYRQRHPGAEDVTLVIEVSDTTLATDRFKGRTYAAAGIPEYWIVNLVDRRVEVYREPSPSGSGYTKCDTFAAGQRVPFVVDEHRPSEIAVDAILP
jgi:Uma2 family endonuclease